MVQLTLEKTDIQAQLKTFKTRSTLAEDLVTPFFMPAFKGMIQYRVPRGQKATRPCG